MESKKNRKWQYAAANRVGLGLTLGLLAMLVLGSSSGNWASAARGEPIGLAQFQQMWERSDKSVVENRTDRSWTWGPTITGVLTENYTQGKTRRVQYFDKARMEQTEGRSVTNGLLAKELMTGLLQLGDADFKQYEGDSLRNIVGDQQGNLPNPTYASLRQVATIDLKENNATARSGQPVTATIDRSGKVGNDTALAGRYNVKNIYFNSQLNHNVPDVFWNFMNQRGEIFKEGKYASDAVFDWSVAIGLPLTEAYWTKAVVAGKTLDVLVQVFERRVLTFTPANAEAYKVEMGNVGQHYYDWRTRVLTAKPISPTAKPTTAAPTATPTLTPRPTTATPTPTTMPPTTSPAVATTPPATVPPPPPPPSGTVPPGALPPNLVWSQPVQLGPAGPVQPFWDSIVRVRPDNGLAYIIGHAGSGSGPGGPQSQAIMVARSDSPNNYIDINDTSRNGAQLPRFTFAPNGTAYVVWRHAPNDEGYRGYLRLIQPDGSLLPGTDVGETFRLSGGGAQLDQPDVAYSSKTGKLFITGQVQSSTPSWAVAESTNNGASFTNIVTVAGNRPPGNIEPRICVDDNDNVHVAGLWGNNIVARSRYNGVWTDFTVLAAENDEWAYRNPPRIHCGSDGYTYAVWQAPRSIGVARYTPGGIWQVTSSDVIPSVPGRLASVTTSPDGRVWVAMGVQDGAYSGAVVMVSNDRAQTFSGAQRVIVRDTANQNVEIAYGINGKLHIAANFKEPGVRQTFYTSTQ